MVVMLKQTILINLGTNWKFKRIFQKTLLFDKQSSEDFNAFSEKVTKLLTSKCKLLIKGR